MKIDRKEIFALAASFLIAVAVAPLVHAAPSAAETYEMLARAYGVSERCAVDYPERAEEFRAAFSKLKQRNSRLVPGSEWEEAKVLWASLESGLHHRAPNPEMCMGYFEAAEKDGYFDQQIKDASHAGILGAP